MSIRRPNVHTAATERLALHRQLNSAMGLVRQAHQTANALQDPFMSRQLHTAASCLMAVQERLASTNGQQE